MHKVLITGITGFLGSHIAENLIANNIQVIGLKRKDSDIWRCQEFKDKIHWVDIDDKGLFKNQLLACSFDSIIHAAWIGVESNERNNWIEQTKNIPFLVTLLDIGKEVGISKFIFLGSQAEYGEINGKVSESYAAEALNAYASVKLACLELVKSYCEINQIEWIWLRLFSLFGEKENENWLIPSLIQSMKIDGQKDFTAGNQKYAYLYVKDFAMIIYKIVMASVQSGIYNISSNEIRTIKALIEDIKNYINPDYILNFGVLEYRANQSMHIEGDIAKITAQIGEIEFTDYSIALKQTLNYYLKK
jgi:UDP-glucose 4-epimerase